MRTAFVDLDPARTVVPVHEPSPAPPAAKVRTDGPLRWRRALLLAALLCLLLDLVLLVRRDGPS